MTLRHEPNHGGVARTHARRVHHHGARYFSRAYVDVCPPLMIMGDNEGKSYLCSILSYCIVLSLKTSTYDKKRVSNICIQPQTSKLRTW